MAFILSSKRKLYRHPYSDGVVLTFRGFEGDERDRFDKEFSKIVNGPKKHYLGALAELAKQVALTLLVAWEGIEDDQGAPVPLTDESKAAFFDDPEALKYWDAPISSYLWPTKLTDRKPAEQAPEGEAVTPDFLSSR